jgi:hypothetical protein
MEVYADAIPLGDGQETAGSSVLLPDRVEGTGRNAWCSQVPAQKLPLQRWREIVRTVGRSSSRMTSPQAPVYAARTCAELPPTQSKRSPPGVKHATARQSCAAVDSDPFICTVSPPDTTRKDSASSSVGT